MDKGYQGRKIHRMDYAQRTKCPQILPRYYRDPERAYEPDQEKFQINIAEGDTVGGSKHNDTKR